jgi:hypothetical protein
MAALETPPAAKEALQTWPYRFEIVPLEDLRVDESYQRPLTSFWREVSEDFNPALVGTLIVSERKNGSKVIIDGQTRWEAMRARELPGAPCLIYTGLNKAQEAQLFADLQTKRRGMRTYDRFRAQLVAKNPTAMEISSIVEGRGFQLSVNETPDTLKAIAAIEHLYRISPEHLGEVLDLVREVWGVPAGKGTHDGVSSAVLRGLSHFTREQERLDVDRLKARLRDVTPKLLINQAHQIREGSPGLGIPGAVARAILQQYRRPR